MKRNKIVVLMTMIMVLMVTAVGCGGKDKTSNKNYNNPELMKMLDYRNADDIISTMGTDYSDETESGKYYAEYRPAELDNIKYTSIMVFYNKDSSDHTLSKVEYLAYDLTKAECVSIFEDLNNKYGKPDNYDPEAFGNMWAIKDSSNKTIGYINMESHKGKEDTKNLYFTISYK